MSGAERKRLAARAVGGWGSAAAALSLTVMVSAPFMRSERVALTAGAVFIVAAVLSVIGHFAGEV